MKVTMTMPDMPDGVIINLILLSTITATMVVMVGVALVLV